VAVLHTAEAAQCRGAAAHTLVEVLTLVPHLQEDHLQEDHHPAALHQEEEGNKFNQYTEYQYIL